MPSYVVITDNTGAALGEGPIYRATRWTAASRLDRAARCSFEVPAADPRAHDLLQNKRQAHYYAVLGDGPQEVGTLIIDQIETVVEGRAEPMLRVSGDNLLAELATRSVHGLELYDVVAHTAHSVAHTYLDGGEYVTADMPSAYDGDGGTTYAIDTGLDVGNYLYVCGESKVSAIWIVFGAGTNSNVAAITPQYYDGYDWQDCLNVVDTTSTAGRTFSQNGKISFTRPRDQVSTTHNGVEGYWIRLTPTADLSDGIIIADVSVAEDAPTGDGLAAIMAYAPAGWTIDTTGDGYAATENTAYLQFGGETVLEALCMLAEHTGEHFRLAASGRAIEWLQDDPETAPVDSGVYAVQGAATGGGACSILELTEAKDSYQLATRVYPYGAQQGNARVTLSGCTETPPAGYTLSSETLDGVTYHYLKADDAENTIGRIDAVREWPEVGRQDDDAYHAVLAANALYQVALKWLQRYSRVQDAYTLRVGGLASRVLPGETVRVTYQRHRDGERYIDIDGALVVLGVETTEDAAGLRTTALEVASTDTWPLSGTDFLLREIRAARRTRAGQAATTTLTDVIVSSAVNIDGGTIDNTPIGSNVPASGVFTTLHASGNITTGGTVDGVDLSAHAADSAAHHAPVTVGNTGLALSGQQLSLALAATSGLAISSGLMLADSIAGNGLSIAGKVLSVRLKSPSGLEVDASGLALADSIAGNGLTIANKVLAVGAGDGLTVSADAVALTTPGTLAHNSVNAAAGNHTHAITASSNPGAAASILASGATGYLQLRRIGLGTAPSYPLHVSAATQQARFDYNTSNYLSVTVGSDGSTRLDTATGASGGNLTAAPAGNVILDPVGRYILPGSGYSEHLGMLTRKYLTLHAAELWVETLVAHETMATIGGRILVGPTTELTADVTAAQGTFSLKHNEPDNGDVLRLEANGQVEFVRVECPAIVTGSQASKVFGVTGNYTTYFVAGVTFVIRGSTGNNGTYTVQASGYIAESNRTEIAVSEAIPSAVWDGYIAYRGAGPYLYWMARNLDGSGGNEWPAGSALFNTGTTGDGFIDLYSVHGVHAPSAYGPSIVGNVRTSSTYNAWAEHWALGNLNGVYGYGSTAYGFAAGKYADGASFITVDATNGIRMLKRAGGVDTTLAQWAVDGTLTIGEVAAERSNIQISAGALALRLNETPLIEADTSGNLALGQIATDKGNAYWNASNSRLEFRGGTDGTVVNAYIDTDGAFVAADGKLAMYDDSFRVSIDNYPFVSNRYSFRWGSFGGPEVGFIGARSFDGSNNQISIAAKGVSGGAWGIIALRARLSTEDLETDSDGATFLVQPKNIFIYNQGLIVAADATNIADTVAAGDAMIEGGLNVGTATGAAAGDIRASGALWLGPTGPRMNMNYLVLDDDETDNILSAGGAAHGLFAILNATTGSVGLFSRSVNTVTIISDPSGVWRNTDTDGFSCVYVSGANLVLRNRSGSTMGYRIHHFG